ncbi:flagellar hook-length control protein FliK [Paucibacter soli]|uniref:flagellar hook-length control protein FliK n=1 Tax=Paucibacter soli TaxID=3133433 RepID=UPI00309A6EE3
MHTNKSTALSQPLGPLMPNANAAKQRNAGMEPAASFASLYKSSREPLSATVPAKAPATAPTTAPAATPAPTPTSAPTAAAAAASVGAPKPTVPKPGSTPQQASADGAAANRGASDAPEAADGKSQSVARSTAGRQACAAAKAAEADQRDASNAGPDMQLLQLPAGARSTDDSDDGADDALEAAGDEDKHDACVVTASPDMQSSTAPMPPVARLDALTRYAEPGQAQEAGVSTADDRMAAGDERRIQRPPTLTRHAEPGQAQEAGLSTADDRMAAGDERRIQRPPTLTRHAEPGQAAQADVRSVDDRVAAGDARRVERGHARYTEPPQSAANMDADAGSAERSSASAASVGSSPPPRTELDAAPSARSRQAGPEGGPPTAGFQQAMNQALSQIHGSTVADPGGAVADTRMLPIRHELHGPGFAPEMGAQLSLLAREGVQSAQLLLNPAEMGPVAVQIVLDGQQAQISFHSDLAETRAVLERSLPDLAAALRENGLTLSGGGVFQQDAGTRQQQQADGARQARGTLHGGAGDHAPIPAAPRRAGAARGVLDTYA